MAVSNFLVLDPVLRGFFGPPAAASDNIDVSELLDTSNLGSDSRLGRRDLFPVLPRLVEDPVEIIFGDRKFLPRCPAVKILNLQLCAKLLIDSLAPDEHRLCQDPVQVYGNL